MAPRRAPAGRRMDVNPSMLWKAAKEGDVELLKLELSKPDADLELRDRLNQTPLMVAIKNNHPECVRQLLIAGADPESASEYGWKIRKMLGQASDAGGSKRHAPMFQKQCSFFLQGKCRYGDSCRFLHSGNGAAGSSKRQAVVPTELLAYADDKLLEFPAGTSDSAMKQYAEATGSKGARRPAPSEDSDEEYCDGEEDFDEDFDEDDSDYEYGYMGFSKSDIEELLCQGVKPWDDDAWAVLAALRGDYYGYY